MLHGKEPTPWTPATISDRVVEIVRSKSELPVTQDCTFDDIGLDSLAMAEVIFEIESAFNIKADDHLLDLRTLREVIEYVTKAVLQQQAGKSA